MKRLFIAMIFVMSTVATARAANLSPTAFTLEFVRAFAASGTSASVTVKADLEVNIRYPDGRTLTAYLANAYKDYSADPARLGELVKAHVVAWSRPAAGAPASTAAALDRSRIVPVVKDRQWLADLHGTLKARGVAQPPEFLVEDFADELIVIYAEDDPNRTRYLTTAEIDMDRGELRKLALANLERILPKIEMRNHDDVFSILSAGGDYEASLLLLDDIWSGGQIKVKGDIVVAVPARDVVLVTGSQNRKGLQVVRAMAADLAAKGPHRLTTTLFVYREGRFRRFGRKS
jgi:uncharacterized protein YtpQ (UPF0354 family)